MLVQRKWPCLERQIWTNRTLKIKISKLTDRKSQTANEPTTAKSGGWSGAPGCLWQLIFGALKSPAEAAWSPQAAVTGMLALYATSFAELVWKSHCVLKWLLWEHLHLVIIDSGY